MSEAAVTALLAFAGAIFGVLFQGWSSRDFDKEKFYRQAKHDAYLAYLNGVSRLSFAENEAARDSAHSAIADARGRIALYGSARVVKAMAEAFRLRSDLHSERARPVHGEMIAAMRADIDPSRKGASAAELFELLYGNEASPR